MDSKRRVQSPPARRGPILSSSVSKLVGPNLKKHLMSSTLNTVREETKSDFADEKQTRDDASEAFKSEVERFIEISKYFSSPLRKTASYISENSLVAYPNPYRMEYRRGGITTYHIKFCNLILEPVYVKLYKAIPELDEVKFINLSLSRCSRVPPGLSFTLGFVYDDVEEKPPRKAKLIFVASRKASTPCYQVCEIDLNIEPLKTRL